MKIWRPPTLKTWFHQCYWYQNANKYLTLFSICAVRFEWICLLKNESMWIRIVPWYKFCSDQVLWSKETYQSHFFLFLISHYYRVIDLVMFSKNALALPKSETEVVNKGRAHTLILNLIKLPQSSFLNN